MKAGDGGFAELFGKGGCPRQGWGMRYGIFTIYSQEMQFSAF